MKLFKRNKQGIDVAPAMPPELSEYYQAEQRQNTVVTWLLGFATLAVTVAIAFALFLGARWIIGKVRDTDTTPRPAPSETVEKPTPAGTPAKPSTPQTTTQDTNKKPTTTSGPQTSSTVTTIPNTGPGDTAAVVGAATIIGYALHRRRHTSR